MKDQTLASSISPVITTPTVGELPSPQFTMKVLRGAGELEKLTPEWEQLIGASIEPNPFFDPDFLIPAIGHLAGENVFVLVATAKIADAENEVICGLLPVCEQKVRGRKLPLLRVWNHDSNFDSTPLIRKDVASETLGFIFDWLGNELGVASLEMNAVACGGQLGRLLARVINTRNLSVAQEASFHKLCFEPSSDTETYITSKVDEATRQKAQHSYRKLCERGEIVTLVSTPDDAGWVESYLRLEASGANGTAVDVSEKHAAGCFFRAIAERMLPKGKMTFVRTELTGQPIAMSCELSHQNGGHVLFKQAVMQSHQGLNPGLILQFENLQRLHDSGVRHCTSCVADAESDVSGVWQIRQSYGAMNVSLGNDQFDGQRRRSPMLKKIGSYFRK